MEGAGGGAGEGGRGTGKIGLEEGRIGFVDQTSLLQILCIRDQTKGGMTFLIIYTQSFFQLFSILYSLTSVATCICINIGFKNLCEI